LRLRALLITVEGCVAAHESAALVLGLPLLDRPARPILLRPKGAWRGGDAGRVRVARLPDHHRDQVGDIPCTTAARTVVDIARSSSLRHAVVVGDAALRAACSEAQLRATLEECAAWSDVGKARLACGFFDARSESPLESVSRAIMHECALPAPEPQFWVTAGGSDYRVDFYWKHHRLIGEADGRTKYRGLGPAGAVDPEAAELAVWKEKAREDALRDAGYRLVRWTYAQMLRETDQTIARIRRHLFH
jgi:hypothetical protein